jgi:hypothetical protein
MVQIDEILEKECHQTDYKTKWGGLHIKNKKNKVK